MEAPFLYKGEENLRFSLKQVVDMVESLKSLSALDGLLEAAEKEELLIEVPTNVVNFVKMHMFKGGLHKTSDYARKQIASGYEILDNGATKIQCAHMPKKP